MFMSYLRRINEYYYFRIRVPHDLVHLLGRPELQRSLKTKKLSLAKSQCKLMTAAVESLFCQSRSGFLSESQIHKHVQTQFPSRKKILSKHEKPKLLADVIKAYVIEHVALGKWAQKSKLEVDGTLSVALEIIGNRPLAVIDRQVMVDYLSKVQRLPSNLKKHSEYRDLKISQILELNIEKTMSQRSVNKYVSRVSSLFIWCMRQEYMQWNPAEGLGVRIETKDEDERKTFSVDDISKLLVKIPEYKDIAPERYFVPLVAMYTGMRLNEICQLYVGDIQQVDEVICFVVNDDGDKRLKNRASKRMIPVHPELVRLGLLDHVEKMRDAGCPRLWMNLECGRDGYAHKFGKWYQRFNRTNVTKDPKKVFHSFRHTVADTLKQDGVAEGVIAEILGHANSSITTGRYGKRYRPDVLLDALMKLDYLKEN